MPMIQTDSQHYSDIADAIRDMTDSQTEYYPSEMAAGIHLTNLTKNDSTNITLRTGDRRGEYTGYVTIQYTKSST